LVRRLDLQIDLEQFDAAQATLTEAQTLAARLKMKDELAACQRLRAKLSRHQKAEPAM